MGLGGAAAAAGIVMFLGLVLLAVTPVAWWVAVKVGDHSGTGLMPVRGRRPKGWRWRWPERSVMVVGSLTVVGVVAAWQVFKATEASLGGLLLGVATHHVVIVGGTVAVRLWGFRRHDRRERDSELQNRLDMARRATLMWIVGALALGSIGGLWAHRAAAHQRHTTGLLVDAMEEVGMDHEVLAWAQYHRDDLDHTCTDLPEPDRWAGQIAGTDRGHDLADWRASASEAADYVERRDWVVERWIARDSTATQQRFVLAVRGDDVVEVRVGRGRYGCL